MTGTAPKGLVIVGGDDTHHDLIAVRDTLQTAGLDAGVLTWKGSGFQRFVNVKRLVEQADVFVLYDIDGMFTPEQQVAFAERIRSGVGLVLVHCPGFAVDADGGIPADFRTMHEVAGLAHAAHGDSAPRHLVRLAPGHPITAGLDAFPVWDSTFEPVAMDPTSEVLATHEVDGRVEPVLAVRRFGEGRVVYLALGHDQRTWGDPLFRQLLSQAIAWAVRLT